MGGGGPVNGLRWVTPLLLCLRCRGDVQIYYEEPHLSRSQPSTMVTHEALQLIHHVALSPETGYLHSPLLEAHSHKHLCSPVHVLSISPSCVCIRGVKGHCASP